jgi:hypothetical protein
MTSPYLDRPLVPLAVALPRMLETIEAELADKTVSAADRWHLRQRAALVRELLTPPKPDPFPQHSAVQTPPALIDTPFLPDHTQTLHHSN